MALTELLQHHFLNLAAELVQQDLLQLFWAPAQALKEAVQQFELVLLQEKPHFPEEYLHSPVGEQRDLCQR